MLIKKTVDNEPSANRTIKRIAVFLETVPDAKGRLDFVGCNLSSSISIKSLNTYILLAIRLKNIKTIIAEENCVYVNCNENNKGAKTFFF